MLKVEAVKYYRMWVAVTGKGKFPIDMLRHDRCCPATEEDSHAIARSGDRTIALDRFSLAGKSGPERGRWASFGWAVTKVVFYDGTEDRV